MAKAFKIAALISTLLFSCTVALVIAGNATDPWANAVSVNPAFHIGVNNRGVDSRIYFYSDAIAPYRGEIVSLGDPYVLMDRIRGFGDAWGIYYRYFHYRDGTLLWTLAVSLWYPLVLFSILPIIWLVRRRWPDIRLRFSVLSILVCTAVLAVVASACTNNQVYDQFKSSRPPTGGEIALRMLVVGPLAILATVGALWASGWVVKRFKSQHPESPPIS